MRALAFGFAASFTAAGLALLLGAGCGNNPPARLVMHYDAGGDDAPDGAPVDVVLPEGAPPDAGPYVGGPCVDDTQCDDKIACTYDSCDKAIGRCLNVPDDTQCQDGVYCNGQEKCVPVHGCEPGAVVSCDDGDACKLVRCDEPTKSCQSTPRDVDQDGDPDSHCPPGKDCNDLDPNVSSLHAEVCANGVDDNCNGQVDETPCVVPQGDTCNNAVTTSGPGTYAMSTAGATHAFATSCSVATPSAAQDVVAAITVPPGPNVDLEVWVTSAVPVAVAIQKSCGDPTTEIACYAAASATSARTRARNVGPGTYYAVATTQYPASLELKVAFLTPTPKPANVDCATATPVQPGTPVAVSLVDAPNDLPTSCASLAGMLTYSFTLAQPQDVRIYGSVVQGTGTPVIGLRDPACSAATDEIACSVLGQGSLYARSLAPGTYVVTVGASSSLDESFVVQLSPPTTAPPDQTCAAPPSITPGQKLAFDLSTNTQAILDGCFTSNGSDAAFDLSLGAASDVLLVERIPQNEAGGVSLDTPACDAASVLACSSSSTPVRAAKRNVAPGDYRVVVSDQYGEQGTVEALVRPTVAPTILQAGDASSCAQALDVSTGGFFTGNTSTSTGTFSSGCDAPGQSPPPGQVLRLVLTQSQRVVLDMEGSQYTTILDLREGPTCPGTPLANDCYVGFTAQRSFLDVELTPGTYWIVIDGYQGGKGAWDLDVRILPP